MKPIAIAVQGLCLVVLVVTGTAFSQKSNGAPPSVGIASWYGEAHRGKLMANGRKFNPDALTAASWFYPIGTKLVVQVDGRRSQTRKVVVTVTDRGPAMRLVSEGRIIDLAYAAFARLTDPDIGLVTVKVEPVK